jgi:protein TonB
MKKICLLFVAMFCTLVMFAQSDDVNTISNDTVIDDDQFTAYIDPERGEILLTPIQVMPEFPGGERAMFQYIQENLKYPKRAFKKQIRDRCICQFVVEQDGSISNVIVVRSSGNKSLDRAALRVIKTMPKWTPGRMQGKIIRTKYALPVKFRITNTEK